MSTESDPWGRVSDDGTVYVRTADGERVVGIWQAGSPDEALAFFTRRYDSLATEVSLLERRISTTDLAPGQVKATITRLHAAIDEAKAVGDLDGLKRRLDAKPPQAYQYTDYGSLVALGRYSTVGNLMGALVGGNLMLEGYFARLMYAWLRKLHELALHGPAKLTLDTLARLITRRTEPHVKLH